MLTRRWRNWLAKRRLLASSAYVPPEWFSSYTLQYPELADVTAKLPAYDALADWWNDQTRPNASDYASYLRTLATTGRVQLGAVLDLACGAGFQTARLAASATEVVGLDASERMLTRAQEHCADLRNVQFVLGDFRNFVLDRQFDVVVCAANSLNYVASVTELAQTFRCVAAHLRPGGTFVFDTITDYGMRQLADLYLHVQTRGPRFVMHFRYDAMRRAERVAVKFPDGIESHERIALDPDEIRAAIWNTDLTFVEYFSSALLPVWLSNSGCYHFVLTRRK